MRNGRHPPAAPAPLSHPAAMCRGSAPLLSPQPKHHLDFSKSRSLQNEQIQHQTGGSKSLGRCFQVNPIYYQIKIILLQKKQRVKKITSDLQVCSKEDQQKWSFFSLCKNTISKGQNVSISKMIYTPFKDSLIVYNKQEELPSSDYAFHSQFSGTNPLLQQHSPSFLILGSPGVQRGRPSCATGALPRLKNEAKMFCRSGCM